MLTGVPYWHEWAKLHPRVDIKKYTEVTEDIIAWHQDSRVLNFVLTLDFDGGVVEAKSSLNNEVKLCAFVGWFTESETS